MSEYSMLDFAPFDLPIVYTSIEDVEEEKRLSRSRSPLPNFQVAARLFQSLDGTGRDHRLGRRGLAVAGVNGRAVIVYFALISAQKKPMKIDHQVQQHRMHR